MDILCGDNDNWCNIDIVFFDCICMLYQTLVIIPYLIAQEYQQDVVLTQYNIVHSGHGDKFVTSQRILTRNEQYRVILG